ncbi:beta strand repeat-containing protein [Paraburkholderia hospita]|uniref:beta strand repeat-containing protein n=1 Tax=Paraburkholderia hospita TaxID=169430 RepID=UPI0015901C0E|nr:hypothetical protein [Paraburkholderia hospita]
MSNTLTYYITEPNVSASMDDAKFDVVSGASLSLTGSSDYVILESGSGSATVTGNNNTISGGASVSASISGTGNSVTVGASSTVGDSGDGNTITLGANGRLIGNGNGSTVYATQGGDSLELWGNGDMVYANGDTINLAGVSATVRGNNNQIIGGAWGGHTLNLEGSGNAITLDDASMEIVTSSGSLTENMDGTILLKGGVVPGGATLTGGVLSVQLGNGNVATRSGVSSGTQIEYIDASGAATWSTLTDTNLVRVGGNMYQVTAGVKATMSNSILDVLSGASLNLNGSSDYVILESGSGSATVTGNNNTVSGGASVSASISGTGNSVTVGASSTVGDSGDGNTITLGANGRLIENGNGSTVYATQGGDSLELWGNADMVYANGDTINLAGVSATVRGNNNQIIGGAWGGHTLNLEGSGNAITLDDASMEIVTSSGSLTENMDGTILLKGGVVPGGATLTGGVLSVQLGNGNVATRSGVSSGTQIEYIDASGAATWTTLRDTGLMLGVSTAFANAGTEQGSANQLVSAMAAYGVESSTGFAPLATYSLTDSPQNVLGVSHH